MTTHPIKFRHGIKNSIILLCVFFFGLGFFNCSDETPLQDDISSEVCLGIECDKDSEESVLPIAQIPFVTKWDIKNAGDKIKLPLPKENADGFQFEYDFTIDWGDGSPKAQVRSYDDVDATHVFLEPDIYVVSIEGKIEAFHFGLEPIDFNPARNWLLEVVSLGTVGLKSLRRAFSECSQLSKVDFKGADLSEVTDMYGIFWNARALRLVDLSVIKDKDLSKVENMYSAFKFATSLVEVDFNGLDLKSVTDISHLFKSASRLEFINFDNTDLRSVANTSQMFVTTKVTEVDFSKVKNQDLSKLSSAYRMFSGTSRLNKANFNNVNLSMLSDASEMFKNSAIKIIDFNGAVFPGIFSSVVFDDIFLESSQNIKIYCSYDELFNQPCIN